MMVRCLTSESLRSSYSPCKKKMTNVRQIIIYRSSDVCSKKRTQNVTTNQPTLQQIIVVFIRCGQRRRPKISWKRVGGGLSGGATL